ncbi:Type 1 glutamine amidotransferase-like domain-containing protein [Jiangella asiatica]|nr:Type 1 glutamine amidotransferase-like domain-containing protein [Jiangella asiatica]
MRLYLSSFRLGAEPERLRALARSDRPVAVIANACDAASSDDLRSAAVRAELDALTGIGLAGFELDLRDHVGDPDGLAAALAEAEIAWLRGGNVFVLRHALAVSGADQVFRTLLAEDRIVYAGYSAGPCCLAPSLRGLELCDPVDDLLRLHPRAEVPWDGLGVLDRAFVPHLDTPGHPETGAVGEIARHYREQGQPYWALRDGQALVVDGDHVQLR